LRCETIGLFPLQACSCVWPPWAGTNPSRALAPCKVLSRGPSEGAVGVLASPPHPHPPAAEGTPARSPIPVPPALAAGQRLLPGDLDSNSTVGSFSRLCLSFPAQWELAVLENMCFPAPMSGCVCVQCLLGLWEGCMWDGACKALPSLCPSHLTGKGWERFPCGGCHCTRNGRKQMQAKDPVAQL